MWRIKREETKRLKQMNRALKTYATTRKNLTDMQWESQEERREE